MKNLMCALLMTASLGACSVPASQPANELQNRESKQDTHSGETIRTVKPGADVRITSELREAVSPGGSGALNVSFSETYQRGDMQVTVTTSEGLELVTTIDATSFDMASGDKHDWTVYFSAPEAGKHYINFHVKVDTALGPMTRTSAAIIEVGKPDEAATSSKTTRSIETDANDKPVIIMQAEETVTQGD